MPHPQGVLPAGNQYLVTPAEAARSHAARHHGLGPHLCALPDELLLRILGGKVGTLFFSRPKLWSLSCRRRRRRRLKATALSTAAAATRALRPAFAASLV
jgi:hypothetical protein